MLAVSFISVWWQIQPLSQKVIQRDFQRRFDVPFNAESYR